MKKLSIEEKACRYDEAIEVARKYRKDCKRNRWVTECMENIFPELKESEKDKIIEALIHFISEQDGFLTSINGTSVKNIIAWLENQGEQKPTDNVEIATKSYVTPNPEFFQWIYDRLVHVYNENPNVDYMLSLKERIEDMQKPADKIKPMFNVGDWVVTNKGRTGRIVACTKDYADIDLEFSRLSTGVNNIRSWTIEDAKDGDVLSFNDGHGNDCIELIKSITNEKIEFWFCLTNGNRYEVFDGIIPYTNLASREGATPATKEQRDLLFSKMSEAGYEWDAEKKELRKVGPKFKVGDWCIDNEDGTIFQIVKVLVNTYTYKTNEGKEYSCTHYSLEKDARLWVIQDSKNGDVLATPDGNAFISRGCIDKFHPDKPVAYCGLDCEGCFSIPSGITWWTDDEIHPATKEERDLLFSKMHKAGYEWDAEHKQLKEIKEELTELAKGEDYGIDGLWHAQRILEKTFGKVDGYQTDDGILSHECAISAVKELYEQKPAWSEEDENINQSIIDILTKQGFQTQVNWLKSLKDRVQPQPKQEWSEEDEKILATIIEEGDLKPSERQWLKSIMPRSKWISVDKDIYISDPVVAQLKNIAASDAFDGYVLCADHTLSPDVYARYMPIEHTETMAVNFV